MCCNEPVYRIRREVLDPKGDDRLLLRFIRVPDVENAWNSDALIWEIRNHEEWSEFVVFTRDELQGDFPRRRRMGDIAKFDAVNGYAIIKVGEYSEPDRRGSIRAKYALWSCDVRNRRLIELIRVCKDPDESYDDEG